MHGSPCIRVHSQPCTRLRCFKSALSSCACITGMQQLAHHHHNYLSNYRFKSCFQVSCSCYTRQSQQLETFDICRTKWWECSLEEEEEEQNNRAHLLQSAWLIRCSGHHLT